MARVHSGASLLLQEQLPGEMREILTGVLNGLVQQNLESAGGFMFAVASRRNDPEAAFWRFLLWVAVRIGLLILTWDDPGIEIRGSIDEAQD